MAHPKGQNSQVIHGKSLAGQTAHTRPGLRGSMYKVKLVWGVLLLLLFYHAICTSSGQPFWHAIFFLRLWAARLSAPCSCFPSPFLPSLGLLIAIMRVGGGHLPMEEDFFHQKTSPSHPCNSGEAS